MGIYIHGMELPSGCEGCFFLLDCGICSMLMAANCTHKSVGDYRWEENERHPDCPLIELPPHGRLGDLDALLEDHGLGTYCPECKRDERSCQFEMIHTTMDFCGWIEDAPTIIPADPGGEPT